MNFPHLVITPQAGHYSSQHASGLFRTFLGPNHRRTQKRCHLTASCRNPEPVDPRNSHGTGKGRFFKDEAKVEAAKKEAKQSFNCCKIWRNDEQKTRR
ncbi:hypothetical protein ATANTOWER_009049 [Ataeniobius toweri]|uniref:Uncharacterized protein n=1 Tax=Ataeniobius toweri TaxID=208326 RepID=A0ABU7BXT6_9TELE|nr:hypothetical protein [Ataeniobius toweri]